MILNISIFIGDFSPAQLLSYIYNEKIKIVALNKQKKGYFKNYKSFNIKRTPTIIFFKNGKEIGRIIERPSESIEENFFQFVDKNK